MIGTAAKTGWESLSASSERKRICSPIGLERGIVMRAAGRRMSGCGRGSTLSLEGGMAVVDEVGRPTPFMKGVRSGKRGRDE